MQINRKSLIVAALLALGAAGAQAAITTSSFQVKMTITSACAVSTAPTDINLGSVAAQSAAVNQNGSTTFKVNCSKNTPFYIGLAPSNNSTVGAGAMAGTGSNTDTVPYQLYSSATFTSANVWGNTATSSSVGNGKSGTGDGMNTANAVSFSAYAQATNADFTPDTYKDTVTVNVNY
jgi:spore coat protein U-like protein